MNERAAKKRKGMPLNEYLKLSESNRDVRVKGDMDSRQARMVVSLVNDVANGKRIAVTFTKDRRGQIVETGTRKVIEREGG